MPEFMGRVVRETEQLFSQARKTHPEEKKKLISGIHAN
jgi:hypothetical protein